MLLICSRAMRQQGTKGRTSCLPHFLPPIFSRIHRLSGITCCLCKSESFCQFVFFLLFYLLIACSDFLSLSTFLSLCRSFVHYFSLHIFPCAVHFVSVLSGSTHIFFEAKLVNLIRDAQFGFVSSMKINFGLFGARHESAIYSNGLVTVDVNYTIERDY